MPRIPVRTTPYHTLPRCTRHYKSKRDLILRALGKASFINGSQYVIAWISPKGEIDVYASELLQSTASAKDANSLLNRKELEKEAQRCRGEMTRRWDEIRRLEEKGEALTMSDDEEEDFDPDRTLVEDGPAPAPKTSTSVISFPRSSTPSPMYPLTVPADGLDKYYVDKFGLLQQTTCKLVVKAWIKVIEPKKQVKFPYNRGEELRPTWWPEGVKHREPDHLSKSERMTLLASIVRSPLVSVARLELATAEVSAHISPVRQGLLREVYIVAKEDERMRRENVSGDLFVHLPHVPVSPSAVSPEQADKRPHASLYTQDKENAPAQKRAKNNRLSALTPNVDASYQLSPFTSAPQYHLSYHHPYSAGHLTPELSWSDYSRSPVPGVEHSHPHHLAPILSAHGSGAPSPMDSPALSSSATAAPPYYPRHGSYMQQQQMDYLQQHGSGPTYGPDFGGPYLTDSWDNSYAQTAA